MPKKLEISKQPEISLLLSVIRKKWYRSKAESLSFRSVLKLFKSDAYKRSLSLVRYVKNAKKNLQKNVFEYFFGENISANA